MKKNYNGIEVEFSDDEWGKVEEIKASREVANKNETVEFKSAKTKYDGPRYDFSSYTRTDPTIPITIQHLIEGCAASLTVGASRVMTKSLERWKWILRERT